MEPEEISELMRNHKGSLCAFNIKESNEYVVFEGMRVHVRSFWPESVPKAVVVFIHGWASHGNRPFHILIGNLFNEEDILYLTFDAAGHGYSSGYRGYVPSPEYFVRCAEKIVQSVYAEEMSSPDFYLNKRSQLSKSTPLFLIGHSMGGAVACLLTDLLLQQKSYDLRGVVYLCPMLKLKPVPSVFRWMLRGIALFFEKDPSSFIANKVSPPTTPYAQYLVVDAQDEHGIGYGKNFHYRTVLSFFDFVDQVAEVVPRISYPFLAFHDSADNVVPIAASDFLMEKSQTSSHLKKFVAVEGGHDFMSQSAHNIARSARDWINLMLAR
jgi:acylglycerol lipase